MFDTAISPSTTSSTQRGLSPSPRTAEAASAPNHDADLKLRDRLVTFDDVAWRTFHEQYGRLVVATIARVVRRFSSRATSEDIREIEATFHVELLANGCSKLRAFQPDRGVRLSTWIAMLASHAAYDFLRRRRREPMTDGERAVEGIVATAPSPYDACELAERASIASDLLRDFSDKDRQFVDLFYGEGLGPDQVATRMGISVKTVYSKKHKIAGRLSGLLEERCPSA